MNERDGSVHMMAPITDAAGGGVNRRGIAVSFAERLCSLVPIASGVLGGRQVESSMPAAGDSARTACPSDFAGAKAGDERVVAGIPLSWCPPGRFMMGSPPGEPERRPDEDQVEVTLATGFWMGKFEAKQGEWKRAMGKLPGELTAELPAGDDFPRRQRQLRRGRDVLQEAHGARARVR